MESRKACLNQPTRVIIIYSWPQSQNTPSQQRFVHAIAQKCARYEAGEMLVWVLWCIHMVAVLRKYRTRARRVGVRETRDVNKNERCESQTRRERTKINSLSGSGSISSSSSIFVDARIGNYTVSHKHIFDPTDCGCNSIWNRTDN